MLLGPQASRAQDLRKEIEAIVKDYLATHPDEVGEMAKDYLLKHPEAVTQMLAEMLKHRAAANARPGAAPGANPKAAPDRSAAVASNAALLFSSPRQVTLGNPRGDVTLVEFFDYSCGFCKRALSDMLALSQGRPEFEDRAQRTPNPRARFGGGGTGGDCSAHAGSEGKKYLAFHSELLGGPGQASKERALAAAMNQGLDMTRLEQDMASDEVKATLGEARDLAVALGINGTPGYVVGDNVIFGAVGAAALKGRIETARGRSAN